MVLIQEELVRPAELLLGILCFAPDQILKSCKNLPVLFCYRYVVTNMKGKLTDAALVKFIFPEVCLDS